MYERLVIIRHGDCSSEQNSRIDLLDETGLKDSQTLATKLGGTLPKVDRTIILSSPEIRAIQTATIISAIFNIQVKLRKIICDIEGASSGDIKEICDQIYSAIEDENIDEMKQNIIMVGHMRLTGSFMSFICQKFGIPFNVGHVEYAQGWIIDPKEKIIEKITP